MPVNKEQYIQLKRDLEQKQVTLVAVSKTKPVSDVLELYEMGQRDFGENYVQELLEKQSQLPKDIHWHFIGHLQRNKVKYIAPFVHLIHGIDNLRLLEEINRQGEQIGRVIPGLLQVHISREETKFGLSEEELMELLDRMEKSNALKMLQNVKIQGLMGMASFSDDMELVRSEFARLKTLFDQIMTKNTASQWDTLSMGMSSDYPTALKEGSTMVRIGSLLFGERQKT